jgi:hypothetical protein
LVGGHCQGSAFDVENIDILSCCFTKSVFGSVVAGAFQITFRAEIHANDVFLFFKNHF